MDLDLFGIDTRAIELDRDCIFISILDGVLDVILKLGTLCAQRATFCLFPYIAVLSCYLNLHVCDTLLFRLLDYLLKRLAFHSRIHFISLAILLIYVLTAVCFCWVERPFFRA